MSLNKMSRVSSESQCMGYIQELVLRNFRGDRSNLVKPGIDLLHNKTFEWQSLNMSLFFHLP